MSIFEAAMRRCIVLSSFQACELELILCSNSRMTTGLLLTCAAVNDVNWLCVVQRLKVNKIWRQQYVHTVSWTSVALNIEPLCALLGQVHLSLCISVLLWVKCWISYQWQAGSWQRFCCLGIIDVRLCRPVISHLTLYLSELCVFGAECMLMWRHKYNAVPSFFDFFVL